MLKLLQDDESRLLVEINQGWKVIPPRDPTLLPKGKFQAKYKDITLPEIEGTELEEIEQSIGNIEIAEDFTQTEYFTVNLDDVYIGRYFNKDPMEVDPSHQEIESPAQHEDF